MKLAILLGVAATLSAHAAHADQCQWLTERDIATRAARELARHPEVISFCEPCGDLAPGAPHRAMRVTLQPIDGNATSVAIDGDEIDLAYTYVKASDQHYRNLAALSGCPTSGVSPSLRIDAATATGVLIRADHGAPAAVAVPQVAPPASPAVGPTIYVVAPSLTNLSVLLLGCGVVLGFLVAAAAWLSGRRRGLHTPRATDLDPPR
jgi:hypothetical protein